MLDLESMIEEADNKTPLICLLSTGSDPSGQIETVARLRCQEYRQLAMGQGQEEMARKVMFSNFKIYVIRSLSDADDH